MAANMRLVQDSVTRVSSITTLPDISATVAVDNLKLNSRSRVVRFTGDQQFILDVAPSKAISAVVLGRHNFETGTTIRIKMYSDINETFIIHDSGELVVSETEAGATLVPWGDFLWGTIPWGEEDLSDNFNPEPNYVYWVPVNRNEPIPLTPYAGWTGSEMCGLGTAPTPDTTTAEVGAVLGVQSLTIDITNTFKEVEIGRLIIGTYIEPTFNLSYNHAIEWIEPTKQYRTEGGTLRSDIGIPTRKLTFNLGTINAEDRNTISSVMRTVGKRRDFYISLFPEDEDLEKKEEYSGIMKLTKTPNITEHAPLYYKSKYVLEEV